MLADNILCRLVHGVRVKRFSNLPLIVSQEYIRFFTHIYEIPVCLVFCIKPRVKVPADFLARERPYVGRVFIIVHNERQSVRRYAEFRMKIAAISVGMHSGVRA